MFGELFTRIPEFYADARANQQLYRGVLRDLPSRRLVSIPNDFNPELSMKQLFARYSPISRRIRSGRFTVLDFRVGPFEDKLMGKLAVDELFIAVENVNTLMGGGVVIRYGIEAEKTVNFRDVIVNWVS